METEWNKALKQQFQRDLDKGVKLLNGIGGSEDIREIMVEHGYSSAEHALGLKMLTELLCFERPWQELGRSRQSIFKVIMEELRAWSRKNLPRGRAALERYHPEQGRYIFRALKWDDEKAGMRAVLKYHNRVKSLRQGSDPLREESRAADRAAVELLESRQLAGPEVEEYLQGRIDEAFQLSSSESGMNKEAQAAFLALVRKFHLWLRDWRQTARSVLTNRRHLIVLGLARLRKQGG